MPEQPPKKKKNCRWELVRCCQLTKNLQFPLLFFPHSKSLKLVDPATKVRFVLGKTSDPGTPPDKGPPSPPIPTIPPTDETDGRMDGFIF